MRAAPEDSAAATTESTPERHAAAKELAAASEAIELVGNVFWMLAAVFLGVSVYALLGIVDPALPLEAAVLRFATASALLVLSLVGVAFVALQPFACALGLTAVGTVYTVVVVLSGGSMGWLGKAILIGLWLSVLPTARVSRLIREHPSLCMSRRLMGIAERGLTGEELRMRAVRRATRRAALLTALPLLAALLGGVSAYRARPLPLEPEVLRFSAAWNRADVAGVSDCFVGERRALERTRLEKRSASRGWSASFPRLSGGLDEYFMNGKAEDVEFDLADGTKLATRWESDGHAWFLATLDYPPPPVDGAVSAFTAAWAASDAARLAALVPGAVDRARLLEALRPFGPAFPPLAGHEVEPQGPSEVVLSFALPEGRLRTQWRADEADDTWALVRLEPSR
ncbi:MAG: hypothetical protein EXS08_08185 [Planctomycetes bacterium]|nr:hypothetical protein [Planctomycetota bacterium]